MRCPAVVQLFTDTRTNLHWRTMSYQGSLVLTRVKSPFFTCVSFCNLLCAILYLVLYAKCQVTYDMVVGDMLYVNLDYWGGHVEIDSTVGDVLRL